MSKRNQVVILKAVMVRGDGVFSDQYTVDVGVFHGDGIERMPEVKSNYRAKHAKYLLKFTEVSVDYYGDGE